MAGPKQLSNQRVSAHNINSSIAALHVVQLDSTGGIITGGVGGGSTQVSVREILSSSGGSLVDSSNVSLGVTIRAGSAAGTEYTDGDVDATVSGGAILFDNSSNTLRPVTINRGLPVTGFLAPGLEYVDGSTTSTLAAPALAFNNSSNNTMRLAGSTSPFPVHLRTSSGADMGDSTNNALRVNVVAGAAGGSTEVTIRQSTFTDLNCRVNAPSTANSSNYLPIRITDGTAYLAGSLEYTDGSTTSTLAGPAMMFNNSSNNTMRMVGSTSPLPVAIISGAGSGGTAQADETVFSSNTTNFTPIGGAVLGSTSAVAPGETGAVNMSSNRAIWTFPVDSSGGRITDSTQRAIRVTSVDAGGSTQVTVSSGAIRIYGSSGESVAASTAAPAANDQGLIVRQVGYSTTVNVSSLAGAVITRSSAADSLHTVYQSTYTELNGLMRMADRDQSTQIAAVLNTDPPSTTWGLAVRQVGAVAASTTVNVSSVAGAVIMRSSAADALVTASQGGTWNIGTVTTVSSVAGRVAITLQHDSAGLINAADSTNNALRVNVVAGAAGGSTEVTVRQSTYTDFNTLSRLADRDSSTQVAAVLNSAPASSVWALAVRDVVPYSTSVNVSSLAGAVVTRSSAADSLHTVYQSTYTDLNGLMRLADRDSSTQVAAVLNGTPASTVWALAVRTVGGGVGSTEQTVRQSTYTDLNTLSRIADRDQSTQVAAVLNATPASTTWALAVRDMSFSTTVNVSSLAGAVITRSSAADSLHTVYQSTFTDLNCRVNAPSTANSSNFLPVRITNATAYLDGSLEYTDGSTVSTLAGPGLVYGNSSNDTMRLVKVTQPLPVQLRTGTLDLLSTTVLITSTHSTARYSLVSSAAGVAHKVYAYFIGSTHTNPSTFVFQSSGLGGAAGADKFHVNFGSGSSGITGANMSVTPPAYLFKTAVADPLVCYIEGGNSTAASTTLARISISYFTEA